MAATNAAQLLSAWEAGAKAADAAARAIALLSAAYPAHQRETLVHLAIGHRDRLLLALRQDLFGPIVAGLAACPECGQRVEFAVSTSDLAPLPAGDTSPRHGHSLTFDGYRINFHVPSSEDLDALDELETLEQRTRALSIRIIESAFYQGEAVSAEELPAQVIAALDEQLGELDPAGDIRLLFHCDVCTTKWDSPLDVGSFLWTEVNAWSMRVLREVHCLAAAYGWDEADILAMSSWRRQRYMELLGG